MQSKEEGPERASIFIVEIDELLKDPPREYVDRHSNREVQKISPWQISKSARIYYSLWCLSLLHKARNSQLHQSFSGLLRAA